VDGVDLLHAELADLLAPEELPPSGTRSAWTTRSTSPWSPPAGATRRTVWPISGRTIRTISCWTVWPISGRTFGRDALGRARCCCCCAGLFSHGFLSFFPPGLSYSGRRDRPCCRLLCVSRTGCVDVPAHGRRYFQRR
jgi:hypothetical protein